MSAVCPGRGKSLVLEPRRPLSLGLGGGLADQQFNIAHVEGAAVQHFHKAQLQEDLQGPLHSADLLAGDGGDHLRRVGDILVKLEPPAVFQGFQIQLEQDVGVQHTVRHTFQQHDGVIVKIAFFEFQVIIFSVV